MLSQQARSPPFLASKAVGSPYGAPDVAPITDRSERQLFALAVLSSAERSPLASFTASSFAQKWRKNSRGCSLSMWLFFMHFWANDDAVKLAKGLRAALDKTASAKS